MARWLVLSLLLTGRLFSAPAPLATGILLYFRPSPPAARDALHARLATKLIYRARAVLADHVVPSNARQARDERYLAQLCLSYRASPLVKSCELNRTARPDEREARVRDSESHGLANLGRTMAADSCPLSDFKDLPPALAKEYRDRKLTPFWAQTYTGAREARKLITKWVESGERFPMISAGVIDAGFRVPMLNGALAPELSKMKSGGDSGGYLHPNFHSPDEKRAADARYRTHHGTMVGNLKNDGLVGSGSQVSLDFLHVLDSGADALSFLDKYEKAKPRPRILNVSMSLDGPMSDALATVSKRNLVICAAGNEYPAPTPSATHYSDGILVGSLSPEGHVSHFSCYGERLTILAPSDDWVLGREGDRGYAKFGGTSGAAPQVEGALDSVLALLEPATMPAGSEVTREEVVTLLERTALPTMNGFEKERQNGAGTLNVYKMLAVARRLSRQNWSNFKPADRKKLLESPALYDFTRPAPGEDRDEWANSFDPQALLADGLAKVKECATAEEGLSAINRAFLLTTHEGNSAAEKAVSEQARAALHKFYVERGFLANAEYYVNFDAVAFRRDARLKILGDGKAVFPDPDWGARAAAVRSLATFSDGSQKNDRETPVGKDVQQVLLAALNDSHPFVRATAATESGFLPAPIAVPAFQKLLDREGERGDRIVRFGVAYGAAGLKDDAGAPVLKRLASFPDPDTRALAAELAGPMKTAGPEILKIALDHADAVTLRGVVSGAAARPDDGDVFVEAALRKSDDPRVRGQALSVAPLLKKGERILKLALADKDRDFAKAALNAALGLPTDRAKAFLEEIARGNDAELKATAIDLLKVVAAGK